MKAGGTTHVAANIGVIRAPVRMAIELANPVQEHLRDYIIRNRQTKPLIVAQQNVFTGQTLAIAGAGPSLRRHAIEGVDQIWACNSALTWLVSQGVAVSAGFGIDQTPGLLREWESAPDVRYYLASSVDPALVSYLRERGRDVVFFHNCVGVENEIPLYKEHWPTTAMTFVGATSVCRAIGLAQWMGFERIDVYGADCAFGPDDEAHANGEAADVAYVNPLIQQGVINGRTWRTRPDMLMGAVDLVRQVRMAFGKIRLIGDTLPVALLGKPEDYLDKVSRLLQPGDPIPED